MARDWVTKHQRLVYMILGLLVGTGVAWSFGHNADKTVAEYKAINQTLITEFNKQTEESTVVIEKLRQENIKLKQKSTTYKIVRPDGTIEERTSSETESETTIAESVKEQYQNMLVEETGKVHKYYSEKIETLTNERKKLNLSAAVSTDWTWGLEGHYTVWGPYTIGGGVMDPQGSPTYSFSLGVNL